MAVGYVAGKDRENHGADTAFGYRNRVSMKGNSARPGYVGCPGTRFARNARDGLRHA